MPNWNQVLDETQKFAAHHQNQANRSLDLVRRDYLAKLQKHTGRNVIAYYSGFLSKPGISGTEINDEDKNGFMMTVHSLDRSKGLDLIIHTPGGSISAIQSIVDYLHKMFGRDIRAIVPQIAMSAGTMLACSCKEIWMAKHSNLGPIDPHLNNIPTYGVVAEFKRACREVKKDSSKIPIWQSIIGQYRPTFLSRCENAIEWSNEFVMEQLVSVMFNGEPDGKDKAKQIVKKLTHYSKNKTHERHIHYDECHSMGLKVRSLEDDREQSESFQKEFQDLVLTVHHCYIHVFMNTPAYKAIENHLGAAIFKRIAS